MKYPNPVDTLFAEHLDGKEAYIRSAGLCIEGSMEAKCIMKYQKYSGLTLKSSLRWNAVEVRPEFQAKINEIRESSSMSYEIRDAIIKAANELFDTLQVTLGKIYYHSIIKHEVFTDKDGVLTGVNLVYEGGNTIEIRNITIIK
jgi:hypothetical protein